jgi:hypothetical protein
MPPRPTGQLAAVDVADLAALVLRRAYERLEAGKAETGLRDAVALLRLTWEIERDEAIPERDKALAQAEMFRRGMETALWMAREHFERIDPVRWRSFMNDFRRESEKFAGPHPGAVRRR